MSVLQWIGVGLLMVALGLGPFSLFGPSSLWVAFLGAVAGLALLFAGPKFTIWGPAVNDPHAVGGALPGGPTHSQGHGGGHDGGGGHNGGSDHA